MCVRVWAGVSVYMQGFSPSPPDLPSLSFARIARSLQCSGLDLLVFSLKLPAFVLVHREAHALRGETRDGELSGEFELFEGLFGSDDRRMVTTLLMSICVVQGGVCVSFWLIRFNFFTDDSGRCV